MDTLAATDLRDLVSAEPGWCVSMYMPTHPTGREGQQDAVRLKKLVVIAEQELVKRGMRSVTARELLQPIVELPHDQVAWQRRKQGLAVFCSDSASHHYWLAMPLPEVVIVDRRFHVKHLLSAVTANPQFYVLALSRNQVRLLKGGWEGFEAVQVAGLPTSIEEALNLQGADRGEQVHAGMRGDLGKEAAVFHGQGGHRDTLKDELVQYFRLIDESLRPVLCEQPWPLILAGVDYELAIFRDLTRYDKVAEGALHGGFDYVNDKALYEQALPLAAEVYQKMRQQALARYQELIDTNLASDAIETILPAAHQGRIDTLFVDHAAEEFGCFHPETNWIEFTNQRDPVLDLVELAVGETIRHRGTVYTATRGELPSLGPLRAIFRY
jgi:hypothetical protein